MVQWREHLPPTNVAWVRFPDLASYMGHTYSTYYGLYILSAIIYFCKYHCVIGLLTLYRIVQIFGYYFCNSVSFLEL